MDNLYGTWGNGVEAYLRKDFAAAERCFRLASPSSKICFNLGMCLLVQFKFQEAVDAFNQALEYDDWMAISYFERGVAQFMAGQYDEAIRSWEDTKQNIRHGEVVDYDSLHLAFMLCKSEVAVNQAIAYYYADMVDECNQLLDEARRYTIVKDDINSITQMMIEGLDVYPCTVDDTILFNPPKIPQSVVDAMKNLNSGGNSSPISGWGGGNSSRSTPSPASSAPTVSTTPKLPPPARTAPQVPSIKKTASAPPPPSASAASGSTSPRSAAPAPPPPPKKGPKLGNAAKKMAAMKKAGLAPAGNNQAPLRVGGNTPPVNPSPTNTSPANSVPSTPAFAPPSSGGPPPPPPPIPAGGIPQKTITTSSDYSSTPAPSSRPAPSGGMGGFDPSSLREALNKRNAANSNSSEPAPPALTKTPPVSAPKLITPSGPPKTASSTFGAKLASTPPTSTVPKYGIPRPSPTLASSPVSSPIAPSPAANQLMANNSSGGATFAIKVLAEYANRKKKIETVVSTPMELKMTILQNFELADSYHVEYFDADFNEYVELDNGVNMSSLPLMLKARIPDQ